MELKDAYNKIDNFCCSNHNSLQGNTVRYLNGREEKINMFADYQETKDDDFCKDANEMVEALETIKELVDLQKEIDCPLIVIRQLFKQDFIYFKYLSNVIMVKVKVIKGLKYGSNPGWYFTCVYPNEDSNVDFVHISLRDYKKTWWLKENKSE